MSCTRQQLNAFFDDLLAPQRFKDYCPNGLQVEGKIDVRHLVTGVTANQALIEAARDRGADAILVHHGYFWRSEPPCITGMKAARLRALIKADINLFAYHLPLDCHPLHGNNVALVRPPCIPSHAFVPIFAWRPCSQCSRPRTPHRAFLPYASQLVPGGDPNYTASS